MTMRMQGERGTSLMEVMVATALLVTLMAGLMSMAGIAISTTENQGHLAARTTEYAQDKMEQLLALVYPDTVSDTVVFPASTSGGTGLTVGGSINPDTPVDGYVDWLTYDGSLLGGGATPPTSWYYERVWRVECVVATCTSTPAVGLKRITVLTRVRTSVGKKIIPTSTVVALKAAQF